MPGFSEEQKALIEKVAWHVAERLEERLAQRIDERIESHQKGCPLRRKVGRIAGFCAVVAVALTLLAKWSWSRITGE